MVQHEWVQAGDAAARVLAGIAITQMASVLNDRTVDLDNSEKVILTLLDARFQPGLIHDLFDRAIARARKERTWDHAQAAS